MYERHGERWTRDELLIALNLYDKVPFGMFHQTNPLLADISRRLGRKESALPMKLSNLASFDPFIISSGRKGLPGASDYDEEMWNEYRANHTELAPEGEALLAKLLTGDSEAEIDVLPESVTVPSVPHGPTEVTGTVKQRRGQRYFQQAVLNAYQGRCAVTGIGIRPLLVASHIVPWSASEEHRLDARNGIALNALHDRAFDRGLITFDTELRLVCAPSLRDHYTLDIITANFKAYEGKPLTSPAEAAGPKPEYLEYHRTKVFSKA